MKKLLLLTTILLLQSPLFSQIKTRYPDGFRKACFHNRQINRSINGRLNFSPLRNSAFPFVVNDSIGCTFFDYQTLNSTLNMLSVNNDGSISACWMYSPDANVSTNPPWPFRKTGYNYFDPGSGWTFPPEIGTIRTGWPNIVVTPSGKELTLQHSTITGTGYYKIVTNWRPAKGVGAWTSGVNHWAAGKYYHSVKACGGLTNENVYAIWINDSLPGTGDLYFTKSTDGGQTWTPESTIPELSSYAGFEADCYSIDATGDTVAISIGYALTDLMLLKSTDGGNTWTKTIIQKNPIPNAITCNCASDYINDGVPVDTVRSNGGDSKVIIDHDGMCHVWFSALDYYGSNLPDKISNYATDNLFYWNENMGEDTTSYWDPLTGGHGNYIAIAAAEDLNGNGVLDLPVDTSMPCPTPPGVPPLPWGPYPFAIYLHGITQTPSAAIDDAGNLYVCYATINELADTSLYPKARRNIYAMMLPYPYNINSWTHPVNIVPQINQGGNGEFEECIYPSMARTAYSQGNTMFVLYQYDPNPGNILSAGLCEESWYGINIISNIRVSRFEFATGIIEANVNTHRPYPIPSSDWIKIPVELKKSENIYVSLKTISGALINETNYLFSAGITELKLNISDLPAGIYFCEIASRSGIRYEKIIKN